MRALSTSVGCPQKTDLHWLCHVALMQKLCLAVVPGVLLLGIFSANPQVSRLHITACSLDSRTKTTPRSKRLNGAPRTRLLKMGAFVGDAVTRWSGTSALCRRSNSHIGMATQASIKVIQLLQQPHFLLGEVIESEVARSTEPSHRLECCN
jgi:hypothetical protein